VKDIIEGEKKFKDDEGQEEEMAEGVKRRKGE